MIAEEELELLKEVITEMSFLVSMTIQDELKSQSWDKVDYYDGQKDLLKELREIIKNKSYEEYIKEVNS